MEQNNGTTAATFVRSRMQAGACVQHTAGDSPWLIRVAPNHFSFQTASSNNCNPSCSSLTILLACLHPCSRFLPPVIVPFPAYGHQQIFSILMQRFQVRQAGESPHDNRPIKIRKQEQYSEYHCPNAAEVPSDCLLAHEMPEVK